MVNLTTPSPDEVLDLSGLRCPHLVIATHQALRKMAPGQILQVITTDLNSPSNMAAWSRQSGQKLLEMYDEESSFVFYFERQPYTPQAIDEFPQQGVSEP